MSYVLLVDDDENDLARLRGLIGDSGLAHASAADGAEALVKARRSPPSAIIADLLMPVIDGYTLLRQWKSDPVLSSIPFMVYTDVDDEQLAMDLGADAFMRKFHEPNDFVARLRELMATVSKSAPRRPVSMEEGLLLAHSERLVRKFEAKTGQLQATNGGVLNAVDAHVALIDASGTVTAVNEACREYARENGLKASNSLVGQNYLDVCDGPSGSNSLGARHAATGIRAVLSGEVQRFEIEYPRHSPSGPRWFRLQVNPLSGGKLGGAVMKHVDVTEQREAQAQNEQSEAQYLLLLNSTAEGIYRVDNNGICTFCNPTAARLLGYADPSEIVGRSPHDHHHHTRVDGTPFPISDCALHRRVDSGQGVHTDDAFFFRADGSRFPVECWSYPIVSGPDITGTVVTFLDISSRRELEEQLLQSQKMEAIGRLAGGVAHDFNNALQIILTYAELLEERMTDDTVEFEYNREILAAGRRAASLTRQLLALSRKQIQPPSLLDLNAVVRGVEAVLRRTMGEDIALTIECGQDVGTIEADPAKLEQMLINLANNARDAMPLGGSLYIKTSTVECDPTQAPPRAFADPGHCAVLSIRDSGCGMDRKTVARIFEPFFTTKEPGKGTGLGLSTVFAVMKQSNGYVLVDSELGRGSEFRLYFPIVDGEARRMAPQILPAEPLRGRETVLLVEDEPALRLVIGSSLRTNGYSVLEAADGAAAIELAKNCAAPIDLLLTDVILPDSSGYTIACQLQISRPALRVIYMSGYTDEFIADHGIVDPRMVLLEKPFRMSALLHNIRETLDAPAGDVKVA
jgi:PAS domain S-box-containing protein